MKYAMEKAVVMTVCERPFYLKPVLDGWQQVRGYQDWPFIFMVENTPTAEAMVKIIAEFHHPKKIVVLNSTRFGVLENPFRGLSKAFSDGYEFVVLAEEDLLPSTNILEFFDVAQDVMAEDESVLAACAQGEGSFPHELELRQRFRVWLWGTNRYQWVEHIRDTWDRDYSSGHADETNKSGFDWNLDLRVLPENNLQCLFPKASLVDNLGQWLGAHAAPSDYESSRPKGFVQRLPQEPFSMVRVDTSRIVLTNTRASI